MKWRELWGIFSYFIIELWEYLMLFFNDPYVSQGFYTFLPNRDVLHGEPRPSNLQTVSLNFRVQIAQRAAWITHHKIIIMGPVPPCAKPLGPSYRRKKEAMGPNRKVLQYKNNFIMKWSNGFKSKSWPSSFVAPNFQGCVITCSPPIRPSLFLA